MGKGFFQVIPERHTHKLDTCQFHVFGNEEGGQADYFRRISLKQIRLSTFGIRKRQERMIPFMWSTPSQTHTFRHSPRPRSHPLPTHFLPSLQLVFILFHLLPLLHLVLRHLQRRRNNIPIQNTRIPLLRQPHTIRVLLLEPLVIPMRSNILLPKRPMQRLPTPTPRIKPAHIRPIKPQIARPNTRRIRTRLNHITLRTDRLRPRPRLLRLLLQLHQNLPTIAIPPRRPRKRMPLPPPPWQTHQRRTNIHNPAVVVVVVLPSRRHHPSTHLQRRFLRVPLTALAPRKIRLAAVLRLHSRRRDEVQPNDIRALPRRHIKRMRLVRGRRICDQKVRVIAACGIQCLEVRDRPPSRRRTSSSSARRRACRRL